jgi:transposase
MARGGLSDAQWERLCPLLPLTDDPTKRGNRYKDHRVVINGILWVPRTGAPWRDLPERYGPWQTCYDRFRNWQRDGTWQQLFLASQRECDSGRLPGKEVDWEGCAVDSTSVKAHPHAAGVGVIVRERNSKKKHLRRQRRVRDGMTLPGVASASDVAGEG